MPYFRAKFQAATFSPKMHMLEEHTVPFMRKWKSLLGFFREQGGESRPEICQALNTVPSH